MTADTLVESVEINGIRYLAEQEVVWRMGELITALAGKDAEIARLRPLLVEVRALLYAFNLKGDTIGRLDAAIDAMKGGEK